MKGKYIIYRSGEDSFLTADDSEFARNEREKQEIASLKKMDEKMQKRLEKVCVRRCVVGACIFQDRSADMYVCSINMRL